MSFDRPAKIEIRHTETKPAADIFGGLASWVNDVYRIQAEAEAQVKAIRAQAEAQSPRLSWPKSSDLPATVKERSSQQGEGRRSDCYYDSGSGYYTDGQGTYSNVPL